MREWRPMGRGGWELDGSKCLTSRKCQTHFLEKTLPGELPPDSHGAFSHSQVLRLFQILSQN